ncbi:hypothetical protein LEP1GSC061_4181 [Leptospira wolffii serovar Khorat str. Khorat-H2]|nr:hypothetical protein LEP1GSC061_4181 [Leptospira wolffii serovar Khorat str. Khorat-H2]
MECWCIGMSPVKSEWKEIRTILRIEVFFVQKEGAFIIP